MKKNSASSHPDSSGEKIALFRQILDNGKAAAPAELAPDNGATETMLVVTASSRRHARGLADALAKLCRERGFEFLGLEGYAQGDWILVDSNDLITHIFLEETRDLYKLETLWNESSRPTGEKK